MKSQGTEELGREDFTCRGNAARKSHHTGHLGDKLCGPTGLPGTVPGVRASREEGRCSGIGSLPGHIREFRFFFR